MDRHKESTSYNEYKLSRNFQDSSKRDKVEEEIDFDSGVMSGSYLSSSSSIMLSSSSVSSISYDNKNETIEVTEVSNKETRSVTSLDSGLHMESMDSGVNVSESFTEKHFIKEETVAKERIEKPELTEIKEEKEDQGKLNIQDEDGDTPLHLSIVQGNDVLVWKLLQNFPFLLNLPNKLNQTPLILAVLTNSVKIVRLLVLDGAKVEYQDHNGNTALHLACRSRNHEMVEALTKPASRHEQQSLSPNTIDKPLYKFNSAITSIRNFDGFTCLHEAALVENYRSLAYLCLEMGADVNIRDGKSGQTILHYFVQAQRFELVNFCIYNCKASPWISNYARKTPVSLARMIRDYKPNDPTAINTVKVLTKLGIPVVSDSEDDDDDDYTSGEESE